jgi:hypothetical protein
MKSYHKAKILVVDDEENITLPIAGYVDAKPTGRGEITKNLIVRV